MGRFVTGAIAAIAGFCMAFAAAAQGPNTTDQSFEAWLEGFRAEARTAGIQDAILDQAFDGLTINERVFELNDDQPEFSRAIWSYLDSAVSEARVTSGLNNAAANQTLLAAIENDYGVDAEILVAIWGLESSYGAIQGNHDAIQALATLAWKGRRTGYGRAQLIGALKILQNGYATREQLKGSWAGAMGQTQFIPTTYLAYAVDRNNDGKRDLWSDLEDVFASTANYLSASNYKRDRAWGTEITLPEGFDYARADPSHKKAMIEWAASGVAAANGDDLVGKYDPNARSWILLPAGAQGPAFLIFTNFSAILKYNNSTAYALAVGLLSDAVAGRGGSVTKDWPRDDRPLSVDERKALQQALTDKGFDPGPVDGIIGAGTKRALRAWQQAEGQPADAYASARLLLLLTK